MALLGVGAWTLSRGAWIIGGWLLGTGLNYLPLAVHAITLYPPGRLEAELRGVDIRAEARRYGAAQFLLLVPFLVAVAGIAQTRHRR